MVLVRIHETFAGNLCSTISSVCYMLVGHLSNWSTANKSHTQVTSLVEQYLNSHTVRATHARGPGFWSIAPDRGIGETGFSTPGYHRLLLAHHDSHIIGVPHTLCSVSGGNPRMIDHNYFAVAMPLQDRQVWVKDFTAQWGLTIYFETWRRSLKN